MSEASATAIVVAYDGGELLARCVEALLAADVIERVVVADNASRDGAPEALAARRSKRVRMLHLAYNRGFAGGVNAAIRFAESHRVAPADHVYVLVNQDCVIEPRTLASLVGLVAADTAIGVAGARLLEPDGVTLQHAGGRLGANGLTSHVGRGCTDVRAYREVADVDYVTAALCAFRAETWRSLGPFEEAYYPAYFEEVDFCLRVRAVGLRVVYVPTCQAVHCEAASSGRGSALFLRRYHRNRVRFAARHLLGRGRWLTTLRAEIAWLLHQRNVAQVAPALYAYLGLPYDLLTARRSQTSRRRSSL